MRQQLVLGALAGTWLGLALGLGNVGCLFGGGGCPCGSDPADPLAEHDLSFAGRHVLDDGCACRCGNDEPEPWPLDERGACDHADTRCEDSNGRDLPLSCE